MFQEQAQPLRSIKVDSDVRLVDNHLNLLSSPATTTTIHLNHTKTPLSTFQKLTRMPSSLTTERCCFLLIHFLFYIIILTIVYTRLEHFNHKQEQMLQTLRANDNLTLQKDLHRHYDTSESDCSCQTLPHPRRNRTTRCLQLRVGLTDVLENIFCQTNEPSQWLTIQNRQTNSVDFNRSWIDYRRGFGHVSNQTDFWIGNENLHWLTNTFSCRLRIQLTDWYNETRTATYETFRIAHQHDGYRIQISDYHGDMEPTNKMDSFSRWHHNARFSTYEHYATNSNCPQNHGGGGWWYHSGSECAHVQLNGRFPTHSDGLIPFNTGILWIGWKPDRHYSFQRVTMAIQRKSPRQTSLAHQH